MQPSVRARDRLFVSQLRPRGGAHGGSRTRSSKALPIEEANDRNFAHPDPQHREAKQCLRATLRGASGSRSSPRECLRSTPLNISGERGPSFAACVMSSRASPRGRGREPPVHATVSIMLYVSHCRAPLTNGSRYQQRRWRAAFFTGQMSIPWPFQRQSSGLRAFDIISADTWA